MTHTPNIQTIEDVARPEMLHEWYLEATQKLRPESFNANAQKPYEEMTDEQKQIDIYIADKIRISITALITHAQEKIEGEKRAGSDFARQTLLEAAALAEGYNSALDQANTILEALKTKV